jgi:hypothetical protein
MKELKKYLVSYCIEFSLGTSFYNAIVECDGNPISILECVRALESEMPYRDRVNLINFWEI